MLKRFILWDFPRASWQYDVMVGTIIAFTFLTPREWFRDQPRIPQASNVAMLPPGHGAAAFWIDLELLAGAPPQTWEDRAKDILRARTGNKRLEILKVEPIYDSEKVVQGYMAFAKP
ncbi:MAG: hypothetical protein ACE15B_18255 [Bryobacteraceae bacterium]